MQTLSMKDKMVVQRNVCKAEEILDEKKKKKEGNQCHKRNKTKTVKIKR